MCSFRILRMHFPFPGRFAVSTPSPSTLREQINGRESGSQSYTKVLKSLRRPFAFAAFRPRYCERSRVLRLIGH